jgi:hypothetical protein
MDRQGYHAGRARPIEREIGVHASAGVVADAGPVVG